MSLVTRVLMGFFVLMGAIFAPAAAYAATHTVSPGENLYSISCSYGISLSSLMEANGISDSLIYPGMSLYIPDSAAAVPAGQQQTPQVSRGGYFQRPTSDDADLLARLITAEADAEPYEGKVAVGAVVLNRLAVPGFPKSLADVIYEYGDGTYQFEPVMNGWIDHPASIESIRAAKDALKGWDPTNGATYFFATRVTSDWLWKRPLSKVIGNTAFTY